MKHSRALWISVLAAALLGGCLGTKKQAPIAGTSAEPDSILFNRAQEDIKHGRYTVGRLGLQTLINTYPDSEYLAKAKLAVADSYYKEGGMEGLKQAIVEYKDFVTFFPFVDEAPYAQLQVGMAHYRQMEKPDRDHSEALDAEAEMQTFLEKYPTSPLAPQAEQRLREIQEVLAEGNFRIAQYYFIRGAYKAAGARLLELTTRYPLYSQADRANWMLGQIYEKAEHNDYAARYYTTIVQEYPLSRLADDAKAKLSKFGAPIPQPDPAAVARMQAQDEASRERPGMIRRSTGILRRGPDITTASHTGAPTLTPASDTGDESLTPTSPMALGVGSASGASGSTATVETVTPGSASSPTSTEPAATSTSDTAPATSDSTRSTPASANPSDTKATPSASDATPAAPADTSQESTSKKKKKKGIHKVLPF